MIFCRCLKAKLWNYLPQRTITEKTISINWCGWLYLQQARVQSSTQALTIQVMTGRQRWWLPDGKTMSFAINFIRKSKKSAPCIRCFAKLIYFWLKACNFQFYKNFKHATMRYHNLCTYIYICMYICVYIYIYIYICTIYYIYCIYIKTMVACGSVWDLPIFRATVTHKFLIFMLSNNLKCQEHNSKTEEKQLLFK